MGSTSSLMFMCYPLTLFDGSVFPDGPAETIDRTRSQVHGSLDANCI